MKFHIEQAGLWIKPKTASQLKPDMPQADMRRTMGANKVAHADFEVKRGGGCRFYQRSPK